MKCLTLFASKKQEKNITILLSADLARRGVNSNSVTFCGFVDFKV